MRSRISRSLAQVGIIVLAGSVGVLAWTPGRSSYSGLINDYTTASAGAWEIHGEWSLTLKRETSRADFSAELTMERSDYWVLTSPGASPDSRTPHTHHIALVDGTVATIPSGFRVTGIAAITANGGKPPFGVDSPVQIDVTGGTEVSPSNIQLTFQGGAAGHFGSQAVNGVVLRSGTGGWQGSK